MANDFLLEIDGIKGESHDSKFKDSIEVESFSWGNNNSGSHASGGGGGSGKVNFQDFHFSTGVNKASPNLMKFCASGEHIKKAVLHVRKQGKEQQDFYTVTMEDLLISSYQSGGSAGSEGRPVDQFSLNFAKIKFEYKPQKEDGSLGSTVEAKWNLKTNKES